MPKNKLKNEICPICEKTTEVEERTWYFTCIGCGSGINLIGIWWKEQTGENWVDLSQEEKKSASERFYLREQNGIDWSNVIIEI